MAVLDFPNNPSNGQSYSANGVTYVYNVATTSWEIDAAIGYTGSQGFTGSKGSGYTGSRGDFGYTGSEGDRGYTGTATSTGFKFQYSGTTLNMAVPVANSFKFNNITPSSATQFTIADTTVDGQSISTYLAAVDDDGSGSNYGTVVIKSTDVTSNKFAIFYLRSAGTAVNNGGSVNGQQYNIINKSSNMTNSVDGGEDFIVMFYPAVTGSQGYTGSQGVIGYTGSQGATGYTGSKGDTGFVGSRGDIGYTGSRGSDGTSIAIQGTVATVAALPSSGNSAGDAYVVTADGHLYVWDGSTWTDAGEFKGYTGSQGYSGSQGDSIVNRGGWATGNAYAVLDVVQNDGSGYICKSAHNSTNLGDEPGTGASWTTYWNILVQKGYVGSKGDIGYTGSKGDIGYTGSRSTIVGYTGSKGDLGYTGSRSTEIGYTGSKGDLGYTGSAGSSGGGAGLAIAMAIVFG